MILLVLNLPYDSMFSQFTSSVNGKMDEALYGTVLLEATKELRVWRTFTIRVTSQNKQPELRALECKEYNRKLFPYRKRFIEQKMMSDASEMLAAALEQMDGIIA
ncbi:hypothetical protein ILYODFUR_004810, partial [Ilyodon furcidens]